MLHIIYEDFHLVNIQKSKTRELFRQKISFFAKHLCMFCDRNESGRKVPGIL